MTLHPSADVEDGWILCSFHSIACNLICGSTLYKASVSTQKSGIGKAMIFGNAAAILNASKSVLSSTRKKGSFPSAVATTYERNITPIPDTRTIQSDPKATDHKYFRSCADADAINTDVVADISYF